MRCLCSRARLFARADGSLFDEDRRNTNRPKRTRLSGVACRSIGWGENEDPSLDTGCRCWGLTPDGVQKLCGASALRSLNLGVAWSDAHMHILCEGESSRSMSVQGHWRGLQRAAL